MMVLLLGCTHLRPAWISAENQELSSSEVDPGDRLDTVEKKIHHRPRQGVISWLAGTEPPTITNNGARAQRGEFKKGVGPR